MSLDPTHTDPDHYTTVFENDKVRVLEYLDGPGDRTHPHEHPGPGVDADVPPEWWR